MKMLIVLGTNKVHSIMGIECSGYEHLSYLKT